MTTAKMSSDMNKRVVMRCKTITSNLLTVVRLLVEPSTAVEKKGSLEASIYIRRTTLTLTSSKTIIYPPYIASSISEVC